MDSREDAAWSIDVAIVSIDVAVAAAKKSMYLTNEGPKKKGDLYSNDFVP